MNDQLESTNWINDHHPSSARFNCQGGFGAFSYSKSHVMTVIRYIQNQEQHHKKQTFPQEYLAWLKAFEIAYDERYVFNELVLPFFKFTPQQRKNIKHADDAVAKISLVQLSSGLSLVNKKL